jgi:hypothetical protein
MKKITLCLIATMMLLTANPFESKAAFTSVDPSSALIPKTDESIKAKELLFRLNEIKAMDKTELTSPEKKDLRTEVRSIKHQLSEIGDGLYLSAGAIIIILLVLIILL